MQLSNGLVADFDGIDGVCELDYTRPSSVWPARAADI